MAFISDTAINKNITKFVITYIQLVFNDNSLGVSYHRGFDLNGEFVFVDTRSFSLTGSDYLAKFQFSPSPSVDFNKQLENKIYELIADNEGVTGTIE